MAEEKKEIPQELMIEVALRLPVKSIGRFKSVSKPCNFFFSSPEFVKSHLHHRIRRAQERIILLDSNGLNPHAVTLDTEGGGSSREVRSLGLTGIVSKLLGCCNGLVLFQVALDYFLQFGLFVINPVTSRATSVPVPFSASAGRATWKKWRFGLGYNSVEDDYKIVVLWDTVSLALLSRNMSIFSLKTRRWKKLASFSHLPCSYRPLVYVDGRLHWLAYKGGETLVIDAFDLSTKKYEEVSFPAGFECDEMKHPGFELAEMGGCLALLDYKVDVLEISHDINKSIDVWIMEKPGEKMCWRKFTIANYPSNPKKDVFFRDYEVICRLGESEFMLSKSQKKLVAYNCETRVWRKMDIDGLPKVHASGILTFRESLACPDFRV